MVPYSVVSMNHTNETTITQSEEPIVTFSVRLPKSLDRSVERIAFEDEASKQTVVKTAISEYIERRQVSK